MPLPCEADPYFKFGVNEELGSEEIDVRQCDPSYKFTSFGDLDDLARGLRTRSLLHFVDPVESNFTRSLAVFIYSSSKKMISEG